MVMFNDINNLATFSSDERVQAIYENEKMNTKFHSYKLQNNRIKYFQERCMTVQFNFVAQLKIMLMITKKD